MTREEYEKMKEDALKNRRRSKFVSKAGDWIITPPKKKQGKVKEEQ